MVWNTLAVVLGNFRNCLPPFAKACPELAEWTKRGGSNTGNIVLAGKQSPLAPFFKGGNLASARPLRRYLFVPGQRRGKPGYLSINGYGIPIGLGLPIWMEH